MQYRVLRRWTFIGIVCLIVVPIYMFTGWTGIVVLVLPPIEIIAALVAVWTIATVGGTFCLALVKELVDILREYVANK